METVVPIMIEEVGSSPSGSPTGFDEPIRDVINDHLMPLIHGGNSQKLKLDILHSGILIDKMVDVIESLKEKCLKSIGLTDGTEFTSSLPKLIDFKLQEFRDEISAMKKENRKSKKGEDKLAVENQKLNKDLTAARTELKKVKAENAIAKTEIKKLKDQIQKSKLENEKLKQDVKSLKDHMSKAGIDLCISSDFT